jgi:F-type H+-transporting ATPase subunit epsilon
MKTFVLHLESATQYERIEQVVSFVGEDASGSFGILPGHACMMTVLEFGLARFRAADEDWQFLAAPGAVVYHADDRLHFSARRYLRDTDYERIRAALREQLLAEEQVLHVAKQSLRRLEEEMLKRLWRLRRGGETAP